MGNNYTIQTKAHTKVNKGWANLKPCKPGETHNPHGRPKTIPEIRESMLLKTPEMVKTLAKLCKNRNVSALRIWFDRVVPTMSSVEVNDQRTPEIDLSGLTDEQLTEYNALQQRQKDILESKQENQQEPK